jgi:addiction module HigA family antidote
MKPLHNIHPGEVLQEEFLIPLEVSAYRLSKDTGIPQTRISAIIKGNRRITADTALRLAKYFGNSAKFWLGLQDDYDIEEENHNLKSTLNSIKQFTGNAASRKGLADAAAFIARPARPILLPIKV